MSLSSFREILIKKSFDNASLQDFIKDISTRELFGYVAEVLEKMAGLTQPGGAVIDYAHNLNTNDADHIHGQMSHHASKYTAAMKQYNNMDQSGPAAKNIKDIADRHMGHFANTAHLLNKITRDGKNDWTDPAHNETINTPGAESHKMTFTDADGKSDPVSPDPWFRAANAKMHPGTTDPYQNNNYHTATRKWNLLTRKDFGFLNEPPHHSRSKEIAQHGENGAYPLERLKVDGHFLDINPKEEFTGKFESHYYDKHPVFGMLSNSKNAMSDADAATYQRKMQEFHDSMSDPATFENHVDRVRQENMPPKALSLHSKHTPLDHERHVKYADAGMHEKDYEDAVSQIKADPSKEKEILSKNPGLRQALWKEQNLVGQQKKKPNAYNHMDEVHEGMYDMLKDNPELENELFDNEDQKKEYQDYVSRTKLKKNNELTEVEFLLKSINGLINKNKVFFSDNPEIFNLVQERFVKAVKDDKDVESDFDPYEYAQKDQPDEEQQDEDANYAEDTTPEEEDDEPAADEKSAKRMSEWKPKSGYTSKQLADMKSHVDKGFSHREAERMANAHEFHSDPWKTNYKHPNQPSDAMLNILKPHFKEHLRVTGNKDALESSAADAPIKASHAQSIASRKTEHKTKMNKDLNEYIQSIKQLPIAKRAQLEAAWKKDYTSKNPEVHEEMSQNISNASNIRSKAFEERGKGNEQGSQDMASALSGQSFSPEIDKTPKYNFKHSDTLEDGTEHHDVTENGKTHGFLVHHPNRPNETEFLPKEGSDVDSEGVVDSFNKFKTTSGSGMNQEDLGNILKEMGVAHSKMHGELGKYKDTIKHLSPAKQEKLEADWKNDYTSKNPDVNISEILNKHPKLKSHIYKLKSSGEGAGEQDPESAWSGYRGFEPEGKEFGAAVQDIYGGSSGEEGGSSNVGMSVESDPYSTLHGKIQSMTSEGRQKLIEKNPAIKQKIDKLNDTQKQRMSHIESIRPSQAQPAQPAQPTQPKGVPNANVKN